MRHYQKAWIAPLVLVATLSACGSGRATGADGRDATVSAVTRNKPPIGEQSTPLRQPESPYRTVVHGDTLYSIAWETGHDYRVLAKWNRISPPYTIKPGQELRVMPPVTEKAVAAAPAKLAAKDKAASKPARKSTNTTAKRATTPTAAPKSGVANLGATTMTTDARRKTKTEPVKSLNSGKAGTSTGSWMWPADGQILKRYSDNDAGKGLDIGGARGQPVRATANGRVVYQGSGLRGYGQLIIVKHSDEFLSAYAHNDRIYVKEGDVVKRGQKIADMGSTGTDRVKLHFEIRRQGTPIDPLKYLPKR